MITVKTNSLNSGDWVIVSDSKGDLWSGHSSINPMQLANILALVGVEVEVVQTTDEEMESI